MRTLNGKKIQGEGGFTLIELIITLLILSILAAGTMPVARHIMRRQREQELKKTLRELRYALESYHIVCDSRGLDQFEAMDMKDTTCYPPTLKKLQDGVKLARTNPVAVSETVRFLRRIPVNPITGKDREDDAWGFRSMNDEPKDYSWDGKSIFDVYCKCESDCKALDGTDYRDW